ncbi:hypothetical protein [Lignipirellula cremea]|uniref:hypothetical protein n=1 Tax=Lignipirellula cremea TaxID=2528010 RepID=UPI0011A32DFA|nr:hypothetical protein [Lignipirellula cremea]
MIFLRFPQLATLQLALTSGSAPKSLSQAPAQAGFGDDGSVWLQPAKAVSRTCLAKLELLGVEAAEQSALPCDTRLLCWQQALPLRPLSAPHEPGENLPILFDLPQTALLPEVVNEILRLGNDRQSFRVLAGKTGRRVLLRVIGPPYYTLLRALEQHNEPASLRAYREQSSRVWVEVGYEHPLGEQITPPAGSWLLLAAPRDWTALPEGKFQDLYEVLEFELPALASEWQSAAWEERLAAPLRLAPGGSLEPPQMWVLGEQGEQQLDELVRNSDNQMLAQLAFAVGEQDGQRKVLLRVRPSKQPPPVLVLSGLACRPYLKLPNLFLPCDRRLHPPLRRDVVAKLLAADKRAVTWLTPLESGGFRPESIPDAAFRPLDQWVDYVLEQNHQPLAAWLGANQFAFESFVTHDAPPPANPPTTPARKKATATRRRPDDANADAELLLPEQSVAAADEGANDAAVALLPSVAEPLAPDEARQRLRSLEESFLALEEPLDSPVRSALWFQLGAQNAALEHFHEATICWANGFWEGTADPQQADRWLESVHPGAGANGLPAAELDRMRGDLTDAAPLLAGKLTAYLLWCVQHDRTPAALRDRAVPLAQFLRNQEAYLPVRACWLAWTAFTQIAHGDVLALARARDRLLERLFQQGLRPETDLPGFLQRSGAGDPQRFRLVREAAVDLQPQVLRWIKEHGGPASQTTAYASLIFAYGFARLGDAAACQESLDAAQAAIPLEEPVHRWLLAAWQQRIQQARDGQPGAAPLQPALLEELAELPLPLAFKINRWREASRILEPHETVDAYRRFHRKYNDELTRELAELFENSNRDQIEETLLTLLAQHQAPGVTLSQVRILTAALELAPRLGADFARKMLDLAPPLLAAQLPPDDRSALLEKGLFLAAHFDQADHLRSFVAHFVQAIPELVAAFRSQDSLSVETGGALESLLAASFRSLRKLGMRNEIGQLLSLIAEHARRPSDEKDAAPTGSVSAATAPDKAGGGPPLLTKEVANAEMRSCKLLLRAAGGWFYFGQNQLAQAAVDEVRPLAYRGRWPAPLNTQLICSYIEALSQAPLASGLPELSHLFGVEGDQRRTRGLEDKLSTSSHFSLLQLKIVEALVLALVSDDLVLNAESRRWLDEDEYLVRRRIHGDVRRAMATL